MAGIQALQPQDIRPFGELFAQCEIRAMASRVGAEILAIVTRVAAAVAHFFQAAAQFIVASYSSLKNRILDLLPNSIAAWVDPIRARIQPDIAERENLLIAEVREIIADLGAIPVDENEWEELLAHVLPLINEGMYIRDKIAIIAETVAIPAQERGAVLAHVRLLIQGVPQWSITYIIAAIVAIPTEERDRTDALNF